jgi:hypothetical protein
MQERPDRGGGEQKNNQEFQDGNLMPIGFSARARGTGSLRILSRAQPNLSQRVSEKHRFPVSTSLDERSGDSFMGNSRDWMILFVLLILCVAAPAAAVAKGSDHGSVKVTVANNVFAAGTEIKSGQYDVQWESSTSEATVTFILKGKTAARVQGKIVEVENKPEYNTIQTAKDSSGRESLKTLLLGGKNFKIVFE